MEALYFILWLGFGIFLLVVGVVVLLVVLAFLVSAIEWVVLKWRGRD